VRSSNGAVLGRAEAVICCLCKEHAKCISTDAEQPCSCCCIFLRLHIPKPALEDEHSKQSSCALSP
jgi:hypothetical protein